MESNCCRQNRALLISSPDQGKLKELAVVGEKWRAHKVLRRKDEHGSSRKTAEDLKMTAFESLVPIDLHLVKSLNTYEAQMQEFEAISVEAQVEEVEIWPSER